MRLNIFKKFIKFEILHTKPETLYKKLEQIYDDPYSWVELK